VTPLTCSFTLSFGMLFSLKDLTSKLSPSNDLPQDPAGSSTLDQLHIVKTNTFTLHHYQSVSGLMFIINTHNSIPGESSITHPLHIHSSYRIYLTFYLLSVVCCGNRLKIAIVDLYQHLHYIYSQIYVDCIARNPLYRHKLDEPLKSPLFVSKLEEYLLPLVNTK